MGSYQPSGWEQTAGVLKAKLVSFCEEDIGYSDQVGAWAAQVISSNEFKME